MTKPLTTNDDFYIESLDEDEEIDNINKSIEKLKSQRIYIENKFDETIKITDCYLFNSLQIYNCNNCIIQICKRVNHVLLYNCNNTYLILSDGCMTGIDIMRSKNTSITCFNYKYVHIDISNSSNIKLMIDSNKLILMNLILFYSIDNKLLTFNIENNRHVFKNKILLKSDFFNSCQIYNIKYENDEKILYLNYPNINKISKL